MIARMIRLFLFILFLGSNLLANAFSHIIDVNIYSESQSREISVTVNSGEYQIISENKTVFKIKKNKTVVLHIENKKISIRCDSASFSGLKTVEINSKSADGVLQIKLSGKSRSRNFDDNITVSLVNGYLRIINNIDIEKYVAGVVEAEAGIMKNSEFYKVQAVACRSYVLRNIKRHADEGFNVCDKVHCQVYYGKCYNQDILKATEDTKHFVIIDKELNFVSAVFHCNCGGQTVSSENVWTLSSTYLKSRKDTFCLKSKNASWEFKIHKDDFLSYLKKNFNFPVEDSSMVKQLFHFSQANGRKVYLLDMPTIHLKNIRADLGLKSTFFSIYEDNDMLIFKGRGFGHGVGLCQEGAMEMIKDGFKYDDIIKYYYSNVYIVSYEDILKLQNIE